MPDYFVIRPEGSTDKAEWRLVDADTLPQVIGSLDPDDYEVQALAASPWSDPVTVTEPAAASAPAQFGYLAWDMDPNGDIIVSSLPSDGGSALTALEISINGGAAVALSGTTAGTYSSAAEPGDSVRLRAVNAVDPAEWSIAQLCPVFVDRFNRANEALEVSANWDQGTAGSLGIVSNAVEITAQNVTRQGWVTAAAANLANCRVEFDVINMIKDGAGNSILLLGRHPVGGNTNGDAVIIQVTGLGEANIQTRTGTSSTTIETISWTPPAGTFRAAMELEGSAVRFIVNGVLVASQTQTAFPDAGRPGLRLFRATGTPADTIRIDNFRVAPL